MKKYLVLLSVSALIMSLTGCGPLSTPLPVRLDEDMQETIDKAWEKALTPIDRCDHQFLLDILLTTQAYQAGVDKLTFRSEKKVSVGTVVMTIDFDQTAPEQDRFEVKVIGQTGKILRHESYNRQEIEKTNDEFAQCDKLEEKKKSGIATAEELAKFAKLEKRIKMIQSIFPKANENQQKNHAVKKK